MLTAHYINEGATLILDSGEQRHGIPVTEDTQAFCEVAFKELNSAREAMPRLLAMLHGPTENELAQARKLVMSVMGYLTPTEGGAK